MDNITLICLRCKKVRVNRKWVKQKIKIKADNMMDITHGFCPDCYIKEMEAVEKYHRSKIDGGSRKRV